MQHILYIVSCKKKKKFFPFCFQNHDITLIDLWVELGLGGYLVGTNPPQTLLYLGPGITKIRIPSFTPMGIEGLCKVIPL